MILIYSDTGTFQRTAVATAILLTESKYLGMVTKTYQDVATSTQGELLGILQGLTYAIKEFPEEDSFCIYTDSQAIALTYASCLAGCPLSAKAKYRSTWLKLLEAGKGKQITVSHVRGHQAQHNPNKVCDMVSAAVLQKLK